MDGQKRAGSGAGVGEALWALDILSKLTSHTSDVGKQLQPCWCLFFHAFLGRSAAFLYQNKLNLKPPTDTELSGFNAGLPYKSTITYVMLMLINLLPTMAGFPMSSASVMLKMCCEHQYLSDVWIAAKSRQASAWIPAVFNSFYCYIMWTVPRPMSQTFWWHKKDFDWSERRSKVDIMPLFWKAMKKTLFLIKTIF